MMQLLEEVLLEDLKTKFMKATSWKARILAILIDCAITTVFQT